MNKLVVQFPGDSDVLTDVMSVLTAPAPGVSPSVARDIKLDVLQFALGNLPQLNMPLVHRFTPGLYIREILMPKGAIVISRVHKFEHPFIVSKGRVAVWCENDGWQFITAPFTGTTKPGTRRILFVSEDCIWTTFHCGDWGPETDPERIVSDVTDTPDVSYVARMSEICKSKIHELKGGAE